MPDQTPNAPGLRRPEQRSADVFAGGCQCGAIRYHIEGPLGHAGICHCRMCQKAFGSWGAALLTVPVVALHWTRGTAAEFRSSKIVGRGFCQNCGTPLYMREDNDPHYDLAIGTLDNPNVVSHLDDQVGVESRVHWFTSMAALPAQTTMQARRAVDLARLASKQHPDHDTDAWGVAAPPTITPPDDAGGDA